MSTFPPADIYIASLGRSGSTLIANLMTNPPHRLVLVEPMLHRGGTAGMFRQMARYGLPVGVDEMERWRTPPPAQSPAERVGMVLGDKLAGLARWGVKEVDPMAHEDGVAMLRPKQVVVVVRDIRDVMLSYVEKFRREGRSDFGEVFWRLCEGTKALMRLADSLGTSTPLRVVRYEDFVASIDERAALARWLDWPLDGDPDNNLDIYGRHYEMARHGGVVSQVSVGRRQAAPLEVVDRIGDFLGAYQRRFGYAS